MSYILDALKKAQSERELGQTPGLHSAPVSQPAPPVVGNRRLVVVSAAAFGLLALAGVGLWWLRPAAPAQAAVPAPAAAPAPAVAAPPAPAPIVLPVVIETPAAAPAAAAAAPAVRDDQLPLLRELPEAQRAGIPAVSFGGYMYSPNPNDRLLLVDKVLRHEGEEVAPGLILEKLLPQAAVMNYRGTRFRAPY